MSQKLITVQCDDLSHIDWRVYANNYRLKPGTTNIWRLPLTANHGFADLLEPILTSDERSRAANYRRSYDTKRYILTRAVLKLLLAEYTGQPVLSIRLVYGADKKPFLQTGGNNALHFNVSHSGDYALIALSDQPVGIDLEQINPKADYQEILRHYFSISETAQIIAGKVPLAVFYKFWTRKEALLKATGKGIVDELSGIGVLNGSNQFPGALIGSDNNWQVTSFPVAVGSTGSAAIFKGKLNFFDPDLQALSGKHSF